MHPWENESNEGNEGCEEGLHAWELSEDELASDSDEDSEFVGDATFATQKFLDMLIKIYCLNAISAQTFCVLCWHASKAGMQGTISKYAFAPGKQTGAYQRHLDPILGFRKTAKELTKIKTYGLRKKDLGRTEFQLPVRSPCEAIHAEIKENPYLFEEKLAEVIEKKEFLPTTYYNNPIVVAEPSYVVPLELYIDGVAYSLTDTVVGAPGPRGEFSSSF